MIDLESEGVDPSRLPYHVAIIMDGNGRWAEERGLKRIEGHREGSRSVRDIVRAAREWGIGALTLYAFSSQNWGRPPGEVRDLMDLLREYLLSEREEIMDNGIRLRALGQIELLPPHVREPLDELMELSAGNRGMTLSLALSYGGREEIVEACRRILQAVQEGQLALEELDAARFNDFLFTKGIPDPDLLVRTSGEYRLSNFLLWQLAYTEIHVTTTRWPDFRRSHLLAALRDFQGRERRFGLTGHQAGELRGS